MNPAPITDEYARVRARTLELAAPLSAEDCCVQSMTEASPVKWHLGHTAWFFETFVLERFEPGFRPYDAAFRVLFNSYYDAVGDKHPRPQRGLLTRPALGVVLAYRRAVDERMQRLLARSVGGEEARALTVLGLNHEQQHQELMLTDLKHLFSMNPLAPAYHALRQDAGAAAPALEWREFDARLVEIGHAGPDFCFDNETPRHETFLAPYRLASRAVTNGEYAQFVADRGYLDPRHWLAEGWDWIRAQGRQRPLYWRASEDGWTEFTLHGLVPIEDAVPVTHLSYFEADAYARWAGARLPTEAEWEHAAEQLAVEGHFADRGRFHPMAAPEGALVQMYGDVWEWTQSSHSPYPGFRAAEGAVGEYNGKFMVNQYVLRGGSCATPAGHVRPSYRNFFPASACWQFSGVRLARDGGAA